MRKAVASAVLGFSLAFAVGGGTAPAQESSSLLRMDGKAVVASLLEHETEAGKHRGWYTYLSVEKSDRTGGHEWTERVAETPWGKVRYLIAEDGKPLSAERVAAERGRLADEAANPEKFKQQEAAKTEDEQHARQMLLLLPKAFLFDPPQAEGEYVRVQYHPNPDYSPNGLEERVLHAMSGSLLIDQKMVRVRELNGRIPTDLNIGFGLLATIHAGSNFSTRRIHAEGLDWKTEAVHTDINGKAMFLKTIARQQEAHRSGYKRLPDGITVADAVKLVEEQ